MRRDDDGAADRDVVRVRERHGDGVVLEVAPEELVVRADDDAERHPARQRRQREEGVGRVRTGWACFRMAWLSPRSSSLKTSAFLTMRVGMCGRYCSW